MKWLFAAILALAPMASFAQQLSAPVGVWRCVMNSPAASVDLQTQIGPDGSMYAEGSQVLVGTSSVVNFAAQGVVTPIPPDASNPSWLLRLHFVPNNVPVFALFVRPTDDPNLMANTFQNPETGGIAETYCQRIG